MNRKVENIGSKFGKLTITSEPIYERKITGQVRKSYLFECDCGKTKQIESNRVFTGNTISCGCVKRKSSNKELSLKRSFRNYRKNAINRNLCFDIDYEQFVALVTGFCHYCGIGHSMSKTEYKNEEPVLINGIDRLDNAVGYVWDNCVSCCCNCNRSKWKMSETQFKEHIVAIYNHLFGKDK